MLFLLVCPIFSSWVIWVQLLVSRVRVSRASNSHVLVVRHTHLTGSPGLESGIRVIFLVCFTMFAPGLWSLLLPHEVLVSSLPLYFFPLLPCSILIGFSLVLLASPSLCINVCVPPSSAASWSCYRPPVVLRVYLLLLDHYMFLD